MIYLYLTGVHPTSVHLIGGCLMGVYLTCVYLLGVYLTDVHLMDVYLTGVHLRHVPHGRTPNRRVLYGRVYVSKSKKALGKPPDPPTLQTVAIRLRFEL